MSDKRIKTATDVETKSSNLLHVQTQQFNDCINTSREMVWELKERAIKQQNEIQLLKEKVKKKQALINKYANQKRMTKGIICDDQKEFSQKEKVHKKSFREKDKEHKQQLEDNEKKYNKSLSEKNKEHK